MGDVRRTLDGVWRIESARLIAGVARVVRDVGLAEDLAQEAFVAALEQWPESGVPDNPGAWLMATAKHRAIDRLRRAGLHDRKLQELARDLERRGDHAGTDLAAAMDDPFDDDLLRLIFTACHPLLSTEARVALTLRLLGGLTTAEIARAYLVPEATVAQRIVRAKRTLSAARVPFEIPERRELAARLASVLEVVYLIFNEGYSATAGERWLRPELLEEALRLGRVLAELLPAEAEVHGLAALMELQASRARARIGPGGGAGPPARPGPLALGLAARRARARGPRARVRDRRRDRPVHPAGGDRGLPRPRPPPRGHRLGAHRRALRRARPGAPLAGRRAQPRRRDGHGLRPRGRAWRSSTRWATSRRCATTTCCPRCAATCSRSWAASRRPGASSGGPRRSPATRASATCCWGGWPPALRATAPDGER